jgi:hypothetical protein
MLHRATGRFAWLQSALVALVLHPKPGDVFHLGTLMFFDCRHRDADYNLPELT